jgi:aminoglycoside phosphotransferase (APT) family kinase protein
LDRSLIQEFLQGRELLSAQLLQTGRSNTNYKLLLNDGLRCVLRLYSNGDAQREVYVMGLASDQVPVPQELHRGEDWSVFSFLDGESLESVPQHSKAAAEALVKISSVEFQTPGWINADGSVSPFPFGGVRGFIAESLEKAEVRAWVGEDAAVRIEHIVKAESGRLEEMESDCRLVHGDFNPTNILIKDGAVSGVLDWEYCHSGTTYMDIVNLLRHTPAEYHGEIKAGLEAGGMDLPKDWMERAELVDLTSHLEFLTSSRSDGFKEQCVARVYRFIERFG